VNEDDVYLDARAVFLIAYLRHPGKKQRFYIRAVETALERLEHNSPGRCTRSGSFICSSLRWGVVWSAVRTAVQRTCAIGGLRKEEPTCGRTWSGCGRANSRWRRFRRCLLGQPPAVLHRLTWRSILPESRRRPSPSRRPRVHQPQQQGIPYPSAAPSPSCYQTSAPRP
jgi:hypothetical protein